MRKKALSMEIKDSKNGAPEVEMQASGTLFIPDTASQVPKKLVVEIVEEQEQEEEDAQTELQKLEIVDLQHSRTNFNDSLRDQTPINKMPRSDEEKAEKEKDDDQDTVTDREQKTGVDPQLSQTNINELGISTPITREPQSGYADAQIEQ